MSDEFEKINTGVFWDLNDFPIPDNLNPDLIYQNIKSALENKGYRGEVSISAYVQNKTLPDELLDKFMYVGIKIKSVPQESHKYARVTSIFLSILLWAVDNPQPANIMVISNNISEHTDTEMLKTIKYLKSRDYNVLLAEPGKVVSELVLDSVSSIWWSASLLDGGNLIEQS